MKKISSQLVKPRIWLDPGIMISLDSDDLSEVFYRKGFFSRWKVIDEFTSVADIEFAINKVKASFGKTIRSMSRGLIIPDPDLYRKLTILALEVLKQDKITDKFIEGLKDKYK